MVGYRSTNIFRVWIPERQTVISTRDVIFDEGTFYEDELPEEGIPKVELETIMNRIEIPAAQAINEGILEEDEEILDYHDTEGEALDVGTNDTMNMEEDLHQATQLENLLPTPPPDEDDELALALHDRRGIEDASEASCSFCELEDNISINRKSLNIQTSELGAFAAGRLFQRYHKENLPPPPKTIRDLTGHQFEAQFVDSIKEQLSQHEEMETFQAVESKQAKGQPILDCMWVFTYKTDSEGYL